jgi:hypothetical protein
MEWLGALNRYPKTAVFLVLGEGRGGENGDRVRTQLPDERGEVANARSRGRTCLPPGFETAR